MILAPVLPYVLLAAVSCTALAGLGGYLTGRSDGKALERAKQARESELVAQVTAAAQQAAAREIAAIEVKHTTIRQTVEAKTRESSVYRDCVHADGVLAQLNQALAEPGIGSGKLPAADPAAGRDVRSNDAKARGGIGTVLPVPGGGSGG